MVQLITHPFPVLFLSAGSDDITPPSYSHTHASKDLDRAAWGPKGKEYHSIDKQQIKDDLEDSLGDHEVVSPEEINGGLSLLPSSESCTCLSCAYQTPWDGKNSGEQTKSASGVHVKFTGEFGYELLAVLPYAYFHFLQGSLRSSESCGDPSVAKLYYFSPHHTHNESCVRDDFQNLIKEFGWRSGLHGSPIPATWYPPPYASHFREVGKVWHTLPGNEPLVIISNKFSNEWDSGPINFIDIKSLKNLLAVFLHGGYHVVYNRPGKDLQEDAWQSVDNSTMKIVLEDYQVIKKLQQRVEYKGKLVLMQDIHRANSQFSFNEVQWRMMARSKCFISVQGGNSILASYFGGKNIIFARRGFELDNRSFKRIYPSLASTEIHIARTYALLEQAARNLVGRASCPSI